MGYNGLRHWLRLGLCRCDAQALAVNDQERTIARRYIGGVPWPMVIWGIGGFALWLALWPLAHAGVLPLWLGTVIAAVIFCYSYLPTHEAQHGNIGRPGTRWRWLNELVGHLSVLPWFFPYRLHRAIHLKHHAHTNADGLDPDLYIRADSIWGAMRAAWLSTQPGHSSGVTLEVLEDTPGHERLFLEALALRYGGWILMGTLVWSGFALEALLLWWLPRHVGVTYISLLLSWAPHHPGEQTGRYKDTRAFKYRFGNILAMGMEYHIIHHLHPSIPLHKNMPAYRELKPILEERGCDLGGL